MIQSLPVGLPHKQSGKTPGRKNGNKYANPNPLLDEWQFALQAVI